VFKVIYVIYVYHRIRKTVPHLNRSIRKNIYEDYVEIFFKKFFTSSRPTIDLTVNKLKFDTHISAVLYVKHFK